MPPEPGSPAWFARRAEIVKSEMQQPLMVWYLSFLDRTVPKWLGGCLVMAHGLTTAMEEADKQGCNPGGEVKATPCRSLIDTKWMNRLLTWAESEQVEREVGGCRPTQV